MSTFLIGPQLGHHKKKHSAPDNFIDIFVPKVWIRTGQNATDADRTQSDFREYKLMVFLGLKTTMCLFFKPDATFSYPMLLSLHAFL